MGMIIVDEKSADRDNWAEYIRNSSDSRIYYTRFNNFEGEGILYGEKDHLLEPNRYYRRVKDIDFIDININKNDSGDLILTDNKQVVLKLGSTSNTVVISGIDKYNINRNTGIVTDSDNNTIVDGINIGSAGGYDVILTPTTPTTAFKLGEKSSNPLEMYLADLYTVPVNIAGLPAISIPSGVDSNRLPIGLQLIGNHFEEDKLLQIAYAFEQAFKFREKYKPDFKK